MAQRVHMGSGVYVERDRLREALHRQIGKVELFHVHPEPSPGTGWAIGKVRYLGSQRSAQHEHATVAHRPHRVANIGVGVGMTHSQLLVSHPAVSRWSW